MNEPLRILLANSGRRWIGEVGHCAQLYESLTAQGHHVVLACKRGSALDAYSAERNWNRIVLTLHSQPRYSDWRDIQRMVERVREERIDLIHVHRSKEHWLGVVVARRCGIPLVRTRHVVTPMAQHPLNRWLYSRGTQGLICVSKAVERGLGRLVGAPPLSAIVHSAVDQKKFSPRRRSEEWRRTHLPSNDGKDPLWIGLIGRFQRVKGQRQFLEALAPVGAEFPEMRGLAAGRKGQQYERIFNRRAEELGYGGRLLIEGVLENLPEVMASLDIGVVASLGSEGMSRVTLEYMASGVPVVATRVGAMPELLEPEGEEPLGIVVPPDDPKAMGEALLALARDPERRRRMAERGLEAVRARHTVEAWAGATADFYRRVLAAGR